MKKRLLTSIVCLLALTVVANAQVTHHIVKLGDFTRLSLIDDIDVEYRCNADSAGLAVVDCTQDMLDHLIFTLSSKGSLSIQVEDVYERLGHLPDLIIYSSSLEEAENSGDSTLTITGLPKMKEFKVRNIDNGKVLLRHVRASQLELQILSGKGKVIADGSCDDLKIRLIGTGEIQADKVKATNVSCRIMGTGSIGCDVNGGELKVSGSGTGKVYYKGKPSKVTVRKLGTIKAIPMDE